MKLASIPAPEPFKPFTLNLRIEDEEEAKLLWHVFNRIRLREAIMNDFGYGNGYGETYGSCANDFTGSISIKEEIERHLTSKV